MTHWRAPGRGMTGGAGAQGGWAFSALDILAVAGEELRTLRARWCRELQTSIYS